MDLGEEPTDSLTNNLKACDSTKQSWVYFLCKLTGLYDTMEISYSYLNYKKI
jgi:hypothetical protein